MLNYRIVEKAPFTVIGMKRSFVSETSYQEVPKFWDEWAADNKGLMGMFGLCVDTDSDRFDYYIADLYTPWMDYPKEFATHQIPGGIWAEFECRGPLPESLQKLNTQIWSQWLPSLTGYKLAGRYSIEMYAPPAEDPADTLSYIWIPLLKI